MQPFWMTLSGAYMGLWAATGGQGAPDWPWWAWILIGIPVVLGAFAGDWLAPRVDARIARLVIILISIAGGVIVLGILIVRQPRSGRPGVRPTAGLRGYRATWLRGGQRAAR